MLDEITYDSFFDELEEIEKNAFLEEMQKEAGISQKIKSTVRGFKNLHEFYPHVTGDVIYRAMAGGVRARAKRLGLVPGNRVPDVEVVRGALKGLWRSPTGRAAILTTGATGLGATGALGAGGYGLYRLHKKKKEEEQKTKGK